MEIEIFNSVYKIVLIGDAGVGKTHILHRYIKGEIQRNTYPTVGVEFATKIEDIGEGGKIKVQIWDTAGQEKFKSITCAHYRNATGALLVYDVTKHKSFDNLKNWHNELLKSTDDKLQILLIGNKIDLLNKQPNNRQVFEHEARNYAKDNNMIFYEVSAFSGDNVNESFQVLLNEIYQLKNKIGATMLLDQYNNYNSNGMYITKNKKKPECNCLCE